MGLDQILIISQMTLIALAVIFSIIGVKISYDIHFPINDKTQEQLFIMLSFVMCLISVLSALIISLLLRDFLITLK